MLAAWVMCTEPQECSCLGEVHVSLHHALPTNVASLVHPEGLLVWCPAASITPHRHLYSQPHVCFVEASLGLWERPGELGDHAWFAFSCAAVGS
jgi:hypothetical protein